MSVALAPVRPGRPVDHGARRRSVRRARRTGVVVYIPGEVLEAAGIDPRADPPYYRVAGYQRSANGHTVIVSLYREP